MKLFSKWKKQETNTLDMILMKWKELIIENDDGEEIKNIDIETFTKQFMEHPNKAEFIDWKDDEIARGKTMLISAAYCGRWDLANLLLENGADLNIADKDGWTALMMASYNGYDKTVDLLLENGPDNINITEKDGWTAVMFAARFGHDKIVKLLLEKRADINIADKEEWTALMYASRHGYHKIVELLLEKGADINIANKKGNTPLMLASCYGHDKIVDLLLEKRADINIADKGGNTALSLATKYEQREIVTLLQQKTNIQILRPVPTLLAIGDGDENVGKDDRSDSNSNDYMDDENNAEKKVESAPLADTNTTDRSNKADRQASLQVKQKETDSPQLLDGNEDTRQKLEGVMNGSADPVVLENEYILAFDQEYLNKGAFGAVYKAHDKARNWTFALKKVLYHLQDDEMCETVTDVFRTELAILSKARHPNIIRLFGYRIDPNKKNHILLFEYAKMGSLTILFRSERGRMVLTASRRLQILVQTASALCFLHKGGNMASGTILHRDIKSDNICVAESFQAKLIDCGLGKLVDDANLPVGSFVQQSHSSAFGTDGYRCPWYSKGKRTYKPACDVYSFGIVIMEAVTGILQGGASSRQDLSVRDFRSRYLEDEEEEEEIEDGDQVLKDDADPLAGWEDDVLDGLSKLAIRSCHDKTKLRPSAEDLMDELSRLIHIHELGAQLGNQVVSSVGPAGAAICHTCARTPRVIRCSNGHGLCGCCLNIQIQRRLGMLTIICPIGGCHSMPFDRMELEQGASPEILRAYLDRQEDQRLSSSRVESIHNIVRGIQRSMSRTLQAIANQAAGTIEKCPRLVLLVPSTNISGSGNLKAWMKSPLKRKVRIYLLCQHSITSVDNPIELNVTRQWVLKIAPALKLSLMLLKMLAANMSIPIPELPEFLGGEALVEKLVEDGPERIKEALEELEENRLKLVEDSDLDKLGSRIVKLVGPSYDMLSEKLLKDKRMKLWREELRPVIDNDGNTIYVKTKYAGLYQN